MFRLRLAMAALLMVLLAGGWLMGQDKGSDKDSTPVAKGKGSLPKHFSQLGLTEEQRQKVLKIYASYKAKIEAAKQQVKDLQREENTELQKILDDRQRTRLKELRLGETDMPTDSGSSKDKDSGTKDNKKASPSKDER